MCPVCNEPLEDKDGRKETNTCHDCGAEVHAGVCTDEHKKTHEAEGE